MTTVNVFIYNLLAFSQFTYISIKCIIYVRVCMYLVFMYTYNKYNLHVVHICIPGFFFCNKCFSCINALSVAFSNYRWSAISESILPSGKNPTILRLNYRKLYLPVLGKLVLKGSYLLQFFCTWKDACRTPELHNLKSWVWNFWGILVGSWVPPIKYFLSHS